MDDKKSDDQSLLDQITAKFVEYLSKNKHRKTPERFKILEYVYATKEHFDIDTLYNSMSDAKFKVSRATLYNTIELLLDCGLVIKHQFGANVSKYERAYNNKENHDHLICLKCGEVKEYKNGNLFTIAQQKKLKSFRISYYSMYIYGTCSKCARKKLAEEKKKANTMDKKSTTDKKKK